jgi:hypothetical protein
MDKAFAVLGNQGYIGKWFTHNLKGYGSVPEPSVDKWMGYRDISFVPESKESQGA